MNHLKLLIDKSKERKILQKLRQRDKKWLNSCRNQINKSSPHIEVDFYDSKNRINELKYRNIEVTKRNDTFSMLFVIHKLNSIFNF